MTRLDCAIQERNRELLAQRLRWPPGALDECRAVERDFPGWYAWWSSTHGGYGASPVYGPAIRRRTCYAPTAEGLRTQVRQDIERHAAEQERNTRLCWEAQLDAARAREVLAGLGPHHRAALTLRYLDGLPVGEVAECLGRSLHATEALLVRARAAFRCGYCGQAHDEEGRDE